MVRHIVVWNYQEGFSENENRENALRIKRGLEDLIHCIEGVIEIRVHIDALPSSNRDIVLNSLHESEEALAGYQVHPEHKKIGAFISSVMKNRACIDYYE